MDVTVTVYPLEGEASRIAKALLAVADHPFDVKVVSHPKFGFIVPEEVFERFQAAPKEDAVQESAEVADAPQQKRRGRPRKIAVEPEEVLQLEQEVEEQ